MNPLRSICLLACLLAVAYGKPGNSHGSNSLTNSLKPTEWLSVSELENVPAVDQVSWHQLEGMSNVEGAIAINQLYHLSQINYELTPDYVPSASDIPVTVMQQNGQNVTVPLNQLVATAKQQPNFGSEEVTIFITGLPAQKSPAVAKANQKLIQAYKLRYQKGQQAQNLRQQYAQWRQEQQQQQEQRHRNGPATSSEEDYNQVNGQNQNQQQQQQNQQNQQQNQQYQQNQFSNNGDFVVIDLGATLNNFQNLVMLDVDRTGAMIGKVLVQLTNQADVPQEIIHIVAQGIGAHVAGAAARQFARSTGHRLRRITALDPSKIYAKNKSTLTGLARADAEFVDAIHTSAYGMGIDTRVGDVDFYPNGPNVAVPGTDNIVQASMRATRYFAESVIPGNAHNFPAVATSSLSEYKKQNGHGPRAYMGIDADYDLEGDYILEVNAQSPFGKSAAAQKQSYHNAHSTGVRGSHRSNNGKNQNQDYDN